jgi:hypothetical protein
VGGAWPASRLCYELSVHWFRPPTCRFLPATVLLYTVHTVDDRGHRHTQCRALHKLGHDCSFDCSTVVCPHNLCASAFRMGFADRTATDPTNPGHSSGSVICLQFAVQKNDDLRFFSLRFRKKMIPVTSHLQSFSRVHKAHMSYSYRLSLLILSEIGDKVLPHSSGKIKTQRTIAITIKEEIQMVSDSEKGNKTC